MRNTNKSKFDYGQKYKSGLIGRFLINNFYQELQALCKNIEFNNCLEVGSGEGYSTQKIFSFLPHHVDFEASEYEECLVDDVKSRNPSIKVIQEDVYNMLRDDGSLDLIFCLEVLEHLENPVDAIDELHRVSNRHLIVSVPNEPLWRILNMCRLKYVSSWGNTPGHVQHWNEQDFINLVQDKFNIISTSKPLPWLMMLLEKK